MGSYLKNWNLVRLLRLGIGISILVQGITAQDWLIALMGMLLSLMPVLNMGCCGTSGCGTPFPKTNATTTERISYEEIR
jgi:hypothetical protein